jgi:hypothetical protein
MPAPDIDLRPLLGPQVLDQLERPVCVAFAVSTAHEATRTSSGADPEHLAPEAIWWHCTNLGLTSDHGMLLLDAGLALGDVGQPLLSDWPYSTALGDGTEPPPETLSPPPWHRARLAPLPVAHDGIEERIEESLADNKLVILVIEVTDEFREPDDLGVIALPDLRSEEGGYHAIACVGVATHPRFGRLLLIKNSWGIGWGVGGHAWLPVDYLIAFGAQAAIVEPDRER